MAGSFDPPVETLRRVTAVDSRAPILLTGLSAAAVLGASGDLSLIRETRGADMDWGGVYGEGIRLSGPWWTRFADSDGNRRDLSESLVELESSRTRVRSHHEIGSLRCEQEIVALADLPGVGRRFLLSNPSPTPTSLRIEATFRPELAPVLIEGIKPFEYEVVRTPAGLRITAFGSALEFGSTGPSQRFRINGTSWDGAPFHGAVDTVTVETTQGIPAGGSTAISYILWGGAEDQVRGHPERTPQILGDSARWAANAESARRDWTAGTPRLRLPNAPELERGYLLARDALRSLYFAPEPGFVGLVAGYPWYAALWCRDLAWMLPAVLWLGDAPWMASSLRSVFRFQAHAPLPILGGAKGELPMQIGPGPIFLYGTSDTTLYYPTLLRRYVAHTGDVALLRELATPLELAEGWAREKTDPRSGLLRNGDEAVGMREAAEEHGRVHYGFDAFDTTIWDSTDRRSHAVDIQVLWAEALGALSELAPLLGRPNDGPRWAAEARALGQAIATRYWWEEENYLFDSLAEDGTPVRKLRPNALLAVAAGLLPTDQANAAVNRAAEQDLATDWGYRTLSSRDPTFNPIAYHDGQVWPIATAWAVGAAFAAGQNARAVEGLRRWASQLDQENGTLNECYRGDRAEPFDSCFLLGFSVAPFVTLLFDGLWGLHPVVGSRTLMVEPHFPADWSHASLEGLSLLNGRVDLRWERPRLTVRWRGPGSLRVQGGTEAVDLVDGASGTLRLGGPTGPE